MHQSPQGKSKKGSRGGSRDRDVSADDLGHRVARLDVGAVGARHEGEGLAGSRGGIRRRRDLGRVDDGSVDHVAARGSQSQCPAGQSELCGLT